MMEGMSIKLLTVILGLLVTTSCSNTETVSAQSPMTAEEYLNQLKSKEALVRSARFVPVSGSQNREIVVGMPASMFFALDTVRGLLCRTSTISLGKEWDSVPLCESLVDR
jgi:hypothetical protein